MMKTQLLQRIHDKTAAIGIVGLGYVGLPLAVEFARAGVRVIGVEVDPDKVQALREGRSYIQDVPTTAVADLAQRNLLTATSDYGDLQSVDAVIICVPTPLRKTRDPDMSYILHAAESLTPVFHPGLLVVLESTTYPGTTEEVFETKLAQCGFRLGEDVFLAFSPERIDPGNQKFTVRNTPKVVGGLTPACTEVATALYQLAVDTVVPVSSPRAAEMVKLLENTFRAVNIGLVNEVALMCAKLGVDVWEVIDAAATKPYGFMKFTPGPGIGGHCLSGDEFVFVRRGSGLEAVTLQTLVSQLQAAQAPQHLDASEMLMVIPEGLKALSFDEYTHTVCFRPVHSIWRRKYQGPMVRVLTRDGRRLTVTEGHPMIVWTDQGFRPRRADQLRPGDELVVPLGQPEIPAPAIDLIDHLSASDIARMRAKPQTHRFVDYDEPLRPRLLALGLSPRDVYRQNSLPLTAYLSLEKEGAMPVPRNDLRLATGCGPSYNSCPAVIKLDRDFARLIGYYVSEGCLTVERKSLRIRFTFCVDEKETVADLIGILDRLGVNHSRYNDKHWRSVHIKVSSRPLAILLRDVLKCGRGSYSMRVPDQLLAAKTDRPQLRLCGEQQRQQLESVFLDRKRQRLETYRLARRKTMPVKQFTRHEGFATAKVRSVTPTPPADYVYSLEVEGTHTFITSYGLLVHNCIPVDPLYLSWKLKALNYTARFIELADDINGQMPHHVVSLVAEALNEDGKPLRGANVLVLGAAYKPDVDDVRESPALDVMIELRRRHAHVTYHDPHVASVRLGEARLESVPLTIETLQAADCVVIITAHSSLDWDCVAEYARAVVDTRNTLKGRPARARVFKL